MSRTAEIKVTVNLDHDGVPTAIAWEASDAQAPGATPCQSMMLSLWDAERRTIAAIDLWAKGTAVDDMNLYFYQAFHKMADTYLRATRNRELAQRIHEFGEGFGNAVGLPAGGGRGGYGREEKLVDLVSLAGKRSSV